MPWGRAFGLVLLTALAAPLAMAAEQCRMEAATLPVQIINQRPVALVEINGVTLPMLVDSGAFYSFIAPSTAEQLKLVLRRLPDGFRVYGHTGFVETRLTRVQTLKLLNTEIPNVEFLVGANELGSGIKGILGRNVLAMADTEYDLAQGVVRLVFPKGDCDEKGMAYWAGDAPVIEERLTASWDDPNPAIAVLAKVNGKTVNAVMDTGAATTSLSLDAAHRAGLDDAKLVLAGETGGAGDGHARVWHGEIERFEFGGETVRNNNIQIDDVNDSQAEMLLGLDYFLSHRIYVSKLQHRVYATWNGKPVFGRKADDARYDMRYAAAPTAVAADDADGLVRRGQAEAARGDLDSALADLDNACKQAPSAANLLARARVQLARNQRNLALEDLDASLSANPALTDARIERAVLRAGFKQNDAALADVQVLDAALPPSAAERARMADVYAQMGLVPEAMRQWALWMPSHEDDAAMATVLNNRCWLRARLGQEVELAIDDCKKAVRLDDENPSYRDSLGWAWLSSGDARSARKAFDAAIERWHLASSLYGRALALQRLGDPSGAQRDFDEARQIRPSIDDDVRLEGFSSLVPAPPHRPAAASSAAP